MVEEEDSFIIAEELINFLGITNHRIIPIFSNNINFFETNIFISEEDIYETNFSMVDILRNQTLNSNFFGSLFILPNGNIISIYYSEICGNIYQNSIQESVYNEMEFGQYWKMTRKKVLPCKECIHNSFCPPISNYELSIGKFNLCKI